ncbi:MAG: DMT family transporter [Pseudomonadota bacterium]
MRILGAWPGAAEPRTEPSLQTGAALMLIGCGILTINDALMKALVAQMPVGQAVALRGAVGVVLTLAVAPLMGGFRTLLPKKPKAAGLLTGLLICNLFLFPTSLRYIPLADAIMLAYLSPLVVVALSPWILGEAVGWRRWSAVVVGLIGAALVIDPGGGDLHPALLAPIVVAVIVGLRDMLTRKFIHGENTLALVMLANLGAAVVGLASLPVGWTPLAGDAVWLLLSAGALLTISQFMLAASFRYADAAILSCLKYSSIVWAAGLGWVFWGESLALNDWIGAALIVFAGVLITLRTPRAKP